MRSTAAVLLAGLGLVAMAFPASAQSCRETAGAARARELVQQCIQVSPATHPPCNAENACSLISDEIRRSCLLLDDKDQVPTFCEKYRRPD